MIMPTTEEYNRRIFKLMSVYLNLAPDYVTADMMDEITGGGDFGTEFAFASLVATACGVEFTDSPDEKKFFRDYFLPMMHKLDVSRYENDPYHLAIRLPEGKSGKWTFENRVCRAYEGFVFDDPLEKEDGRILPQIGFFTRDYAYPAVLEGGREWMTLMPNEINTTLPAVARSHGRVLTYGLGLGYFAFMAARKEEVEHVTVVEKSRDAISLFETLIAPQMENRDKITVVEADAFDFAAHRMKDGRYDVVFTDLWHDPSDGVELYLRMKEYEKELPGAEFLYWIEKTLKLYM